MPESSSVRDLRQEIHKLRSDCGRSRQPRHQQALERLELALESLIGVPHPYALKLDQKKLLEDGEAAFKTGGNGMNAVIPGAGYLYRISNIYDLIYNADVARAPSERMDPSLVWERLLNTSEGRWLKFDAPGDRRYFGFSSISWWTDEFVKEDVVLSALKAGLFTNWLGQYSALMRCSASTLNTNYLSYVPTVIDAFCQLVFHPTEEIKNPTAGITIDLSQTGPLVTGVREYVLKPIELRNLEFLPVEITVRMKREKFRKHSDRNSSQLAKLITYYETLKVPVRQGGNF